MEDFPVGTLQAVCLGSSVVLSGLFYYIYRKRRKTADKLSNAPLIALNENLVDLLNATPGKCLQYVVIEGTAQPVGEPLRSQYQEGSVGLIQKLVLQEHKLVWNNLARTWTDRADLLHQHVNVVPFMLVGGDGASVRVLRPLEATGPEMETVHEKFYQASYGFTELLGHFLGGEKPKGQLETEEMLKVGASVTAVGELILDTDHLLKLHPPTDGSEYFLTTGDVESLRLEQEEQAVCYWTLACVCALVGGAVLLWVGRRYYKCIQARREREREQREFDGTYGGAGEEAADNTCVICLSSPRECVLLDCGHVCCCHRCYRALLRPTCPVCMQTIRRVVPLYQA